MLFDLGVSSMQLDLTERGFAYAQDAPLDMRMNPGDGPDRRRRPQHVHRRATSRGCCRSTARSVSPGASPRRSSRQRADEPFTTSARLVDLIRASIPAAARRTGGNPAKRTFQALRIEVNDELGAYERALPAALDVVEPGGRVVVLAYHSLEDRLTKRAFAAVTTTDVPRDVPFVPEGHEPAFRLLTRGAEQASEAETDDQPASPLGPAPRGRTDRGMNALQHIAPRRGCDRRSRSRASRAPPPRRPGQQPGPQGAVRRRGADAGRHGPGRA